MKRKVKRIVTRQREWPSHGTFSYVELECLHTLKHERQQEGDVHDCKGCDRDAAQIEKIKQLHSEGKIAYITLKDLTAGKTGEWMVYCAYYKNSKSPTGVSGYEGVSWNKFTTRALVDAGFTLYRGPQRSSR